MSDNMRWKAYFFMGLGSIAIAFYGLILALSLKTSSAHYSSSLWLCLITSAAFVLVGAVHSYTAFAFKYGRLDEVSGSREAAVFIRAGKNIKQGARIQLIRIFGSDNLSLTDDQRRVLFIGDWRPWVCPLSKFKCIERRTDISDG